MYKYVAVEDENFNIWQYSTTYPVAVLIPMKKHGVYKVHGFAVANNWVYDSSKEHCRDLTPKTLSELGYFEELPSDPNALFDLGYFEKRPNNLVKYNGKQYVMADSVRHFAVMMNDWPSKGSTAGMQISLPYEGPENKAGTPIERLPYPGPENKAGNDWPSKGSKAGMRISYEHPLF